VIVPGEFAESILVKTQSGSSPHLEFSPEELAQVNVWIDAGAPEK
jgi:hypothetical protein